jgi:hypothetical protein
VAKIKSRLNIVNKYFKVEIHYKVLIGFQAYKKNKKQIAKEQLNILKVAIFSV